MNISIPIIIDSSFMLGVNSASWQICVLADRYKRLLNKYVRITFKDGNKLHGIVTGVKDDGRETGVATLEVTSIVKLAMGFNFKASSTTYSTTITGDDAGECYKGIKFGTPNSTTGEYEKTSINHYLKTLINSASEQARSFWGKRIEYQTTGQNSKKIITALKWTGDKIETLFFNLLGTTFDIVTEINGETITVRNVDKTKQDRIISTRDIHSQSIGYDLMSSLAQVIIESPDVNSNKTTATLSASNRFYGMLRNLDNTFGTNEFTGTVTEGYFDAERNVFKYKNLSSVTGEFHINYDKRYRYSTTKKGEAYIKHGWKLPAVIVDDDLGRAGNDDSTYLDVTFDRTDEMRDIAEYYAAVMGDIEYQGTMTLKEEKRVRVGDVVKLPTGERVIIKSISYNLGSPLKIVNYGSIEGNPYIAIKERVQLSEYKYKEKRTQNERVSVPPPLPGIFIKATGRGFPQAQASKRMSFRQTPMGITPVVPIIAFGGSGRSKQRTQQTHNRIEAHRQSVKERLAKQQALNDVNDMYGE